MNFKQQKTTLCEKCKEMTYKTEDESVSICQGCGYRGARTKPFRRHKNYQTIEPELITHSLYEAQLPDSVSDQFDAVMGRFHKLSEREKQVVELLWEGKTQEEAAKILSISRDEVNTYIKRARVKLR